MIVLKIGGSTLGRHDTSLDDIAALHAQGRRFVAVHGGGVTISEWLDRAGAPTRFIRGLRATDAPALEIVVAVLAGLVNKRLVAGLEARGARAIGVSGADAAILRARRYDDDLGFVGEVTAVDADALRALAADAVLVLAPIAIEDGSSQLLNVNADTAAGEVAAALAAERLVLLTDVPGVLDDAGNLVPHLTPDATRDLLERGTIQGGMIPKVQAALRAAAAGVPAAVIDGRAPGALAALLTTGTASGTAIR